MVDICNIESKSDNYIKIMKKPNIQKLRSFGFAERDGEYKYSRELLGGQMKMEISVSQGGEINTKVTDVDSGDEYVLHRIDTACGAFVGKVRAEYQAVMDEIALKCFEPDVFKSVQAKEIIAYVRDTYGDELEFLWQKFPENAVWRRADNKKWYAALLCVSKRKLGFDTDAPVEILDLRMKPEDIENRVDNKKYFPGYHMNKKHWITICLDGSVPTTEICGRIDESYTLAVK